MSDDSACPRCHGGGWVPTIVEVGRPSRVANCVLCDGTGAVSGEKTAWISDGTRCRQGRKARRMSLLDAGRALGVSPIDLSRMESGRCAPSAEYRAWCGMEGDGMPSVAQGADR